MPALVCSPLSPHRFNMCICIVCVCIGKYGFIGMALISQCLNFFLKSVLFLMIFVCLCMGLCNAWGGQKRAPYLPELEL